MEATARKPGNVHPGSSFCDLCYDDFVEAAHAVASPLAAVCNVGLGSAVLESVRATRAATGTNVNLGIILLLAPLAAVPVRESLDQGVIRVLEQTTINDAEKVYVAIKLAQPGGMGDAVSQDLAERPTVTLRDAMIVAANRDRIAEQYASNFQLVFASRRKLCELWTDTSDWETSIVLLHVWMMSQWPDTLIARKCGRETSVQASTLAIKLMANRSRGEPLDSIELQEFDAWLRADGHRRNPGTTADLVVATLFAAVRDGLITIPTRDAIRQRAEVIRAEAARC